MELNNIFINILKEELITALGCTEPIALALGSAKCREVLGNMPERIEVYSSGNIIKNVKGVVIPGTSNLKGIELSSILGCLVGDSSKGLEVLTGIDDDMINEAKHLYENKFCKVYRKTTQAKLHFEVFMYYKNDVASVEVMHTHTNIVNITKNNQRILYNPCKEVELNSSLTDREGLSVENIYNFAKNGDITELYDILKNQIECNVTIAKEGLENDYGLCVGKTLYRCKHICDKEKMKAFAAAGSDARMSGCDLPVVINSGSGNQGLTIATSVYSYGQSNNIDEETLYRALVIANLIPIHIKTKIGRLSAFCGAVTASIGVGCAVSFINGGTLKQIEDTIKNAIANLTGVICDGAKPSCAIKIASSIDASFLAYQLSMNGHVVENSCGIIEECVEDTIRNVGNIASNGMKETDELILNIMNSN